MAEADLDPDQSALLEKLLGKDYEVITADDRLDKLADDFVEHCSTRWESGKSMFVCIDKITCARMYQRILPRWQARLQELRNQVPIAEAQLAAATNEELRDKRAADLAKLHGRIAWMDSTIIAIIISEGQNEVKDFRRWDFDIIPHRERMKRGFTAPGGRTMSVEDAFKSPDHPFRVAIVCAMWLTGFDVECLSTLYIDKPMKAHTLMQAIARANRVYPGKDCGVIVDYNGMLKSLRQALAQYAVGDDDDAPLSDVVAPIETLVASLVDALEVTENHLRGLGFEPDRLKGASGFTRIAALSDATNALYTSDEAKRRYEIMARVVFSRFKALITEPSVYAYAARHDNIEAIYKNEIIADYNREKDRATVEQTFAAVMALAASLDEEERRTVEEGLSREELAIFDLLKRENITKVDRERVKQASRSLLARIQELLAPMRHWTRNAQTQAEVETSILDWLYETLPRPPFTEADTTQLAGRLYEHVWQQSEAGAFAGEASVS